MRLLISSSSTHPLVFFDIEASFFRIDGMSTMTDAVSFYEKIAEWLRSHQSFIKPCSELVVNLRFINSATIKALYKFFQIISKEKVPMQIILIRAADMENADVIEVLSETCLLLGLGFEVRRTSKSS
jgi:5-methylcytosine-specific restriction endonuclease McrBC GTP-binding regulatory subunit McrB